MAAARAMRMLMMILLTFAARLISAQAAGRQLSDAKNGIASTGLTASNGLDGGSKGTADGKQVKPVNIKEKGVEKMLSSSADTEHHFSNEANQHESGLMFSYVDYSAPRHHPPKNN